MTLIKTVHIWLVCIVHNIGLVTLALIALLNIPLLKWLKRVSEDQWSGN
jgi:hypothetical protein